MAIPAHVGGNFAPGIFITTPSRPGSATIPEDAQHAQQKAVKASEMARDSEQQAEQETESGDVTIDSMGSPIDLSPPESATARHLDNDLLSAASSFASPLPLVPNAPPPQRAGMPAVDSLVMKPVVLKPPPVSLLTSLITQQKTKDENPFAEEFLKIAGVGEPNPVQLKIYIPHSDKPKDPMQVFVKREATIEDVIGYILYQYYHEGRTPQLNDDQSTVVQWNLRIVEDDGEIDDDLPGKQNVVGPDGEI